MGAKQALNNFASTEGLVIDYDADEVYLALSMKNLAKGFTASYKAGADTAPPLKKRAAISLQGKSSTLRRLTFITSGCSVS